MELQKFVDEPLGKFDLNLNMNEKNYKNLHKYKYET